MAGILEGVRVVDMGHFVAIPSAAVIMADWGADVVKVEPLSGDMQRGARDGLVKFGGVEVSWRFLLHNRNKKSLAVDLTKESGRDIVYKLVERADIFMSNYELSSLKKLKFDYAALHQLNPKLVYAMLTAYGTEGPDKDQRGFDFAAAWARSGIQHMVGEPGSLPSVQRPGMMDRVAGMHVVAGVLAALLHRENTGRGQELEFSLYHSAVWTLAPDIQGNLLGLPQLKHDRTKPRNPLVNTYRTKDDQWLQLAMLQADVQWPSFCQAIERPELENDPRFSNMQTRAEHCEELVRIIDKVFASRNRDEWEKRLRGSDCIYGRVQTPLEVITDPQAVANGFFAEIEHPAVGEMKLVTSPVKFRQNPASIRTSAPEVGQHTEEILLDLGYNWEDITRLKEQEVIL